MAVDPKCGCSLGRAASANVAQGAEAIYQLRLGNGSWQDTDERAYRYNIEHCPEDTRIVYAAPPAQTTLTTEQITDIRRAAVLIRENSYPCPDKPHSNWALADRIEKVIAALTAAQSGADRE
jgi:hypothetical protein